MQSDFRCKIYLLLALSFFFAYPSAALAIPAITCHCFTDRSFDPAHPATADPYFLASTQNSFFADVFGVDKKTIVIKKQTGTSSDDLWIAYWVASKSGNSPENLLQGINSRKTWQEVIIPLHLTSKTVGSEFTGALNSRATAAHLANTVVDELFRNYKLLSDRDLAALRQAGISNQELIISTIISLKTRQPATQIYKEVKSGSKTWGGFMQRAKIDIKNMQQEISVILKSHAS